MRTKIWNDEQLIKAVENSISTRGVLIKLGLRPAGGNYVQVKRRILALQLNTEHFLGRGWNVGLKFVPNKPIPLTKILVKDSTFQSYKLKARLFKDGIRKVECELCGWKTQSSDGRIPLELDHINGDRYDNRIENLRILCPNCHSLQTTHRGLNSVK